jgi:hypothetical protein
MSTIPKTGRTAMQHMLADIWPHTKRRTVSVLVHNASGFAFWRAVGYKDYTLTLEIMPRLHHLPNSFRVAVRLALAKSV